MVSFGSSLDPRMSFRRSSTHVFGNQRERNSSINCSNSSVRRRLRFTDIQSFTSLSSKQPRILATF